MASFLLLVSLVIHLTSELVWCHVALKFPPARKYDFDFLDNVRTKPPCGMPKGELVTDLAAGTDLEIFWHLSYPHRGGHRIQLLDSKDRPIMDLTPVIGNNSYVTSDVTAQSQNITLPNDLECLNCTIRLLRQANEWSNKYQFWSCADVNILPKTKHKETCGGHGRRLIGRCRCDALYYGNVCQYKNECDDDKDCGLHGKCIDTHATTDPRKRCYCEAGWFGEQCKTKSPIRDTNLDLSLYSKKILSDRFTLYWRLLRDQNEIEMAMVAIGKGYVAVGWRPSGIDQKCKAFPYVPDSGVSDDNTAAHGSEHEAIAEPEGTSKESVNNEPLPETEPKDDLGRKGTSPTVEPEPAPEQDPSEKLEVTHPQSNGRESKLVEAAEMIKSPTEEKASMEIKKEASKAGPLPEGDSESLAGPDDDNNRAKPTPISETVSEDSVQSEPVPESEPEPEKSAEDNYSTQSPTSIDYPTQPIESPKQNSETEVVETPAKITSSVSYSVSNSQAQSLHRRKREEVSSEPEPNAESEPEPNAESEPEPNADGEPEPNANGEPESEPKSEAEPDRISTLVPLHHSEYTPKGDFHPMDCTDMVIGFARGSLSRIDDYYTRDRSTPREDSFYGGKSDLTAAMGFEKDGVTTVMFRKKLDTNERSDQPISNTIMDVIWAQGQEENNYIHNPKSGLETEKAGRPKFYGQDELKYHGQGSQRGKFAINFFEEEDSGNLGVISACGGEWGYPKGCMETKNCEYRALWGYSGKDDRMDFTIETKNYDRWTGIGFSDDLKMSQTDAVIGWVSSGGRPFIGDYWISGYVRPSLDTNQDIFDTSGVFQDGVTTLKFSRKRFTKDSNDKGFNDTHCLYMFYVVKGGLFNPVSKRINKHEIAPIFSQSKVCIRSCGGEQNEGDAGDILKRPPPKPTLEFDVGIKLVDLGSNYIVPEKDTADYKQLSDRVKRDISSVLEGLPGFKDIEILDLETIQDENKLVAKMNIILDENEAQKGDTSPKAMLMSALKEPVTRGQIGALRVDPYYLQISDPQVVNKSPTEATTEFPFGLTLKMIIILACIGGLVLVAFIQAICSMRKTSKNRQPRNQKERLISNSAWKDYSTGSTNYAYENFETDDPKGTKGGKGPKVNGVRNGHGNVVPYNDTRSLNRPQKNGQPRTSSGDKFTYSLPRTNHPSSYSTNTNGYMDRSSRGHRGPNELQPDFYFMPSQRKYSGEVVRVYVDYNQQK